MGRTRRKGGLSWWPWGNKETKKTWRMGTDTAPPPTPQKSWRPWGITKLLEGETCIINTVEKRSAEIAEDILRRALDNLEEKNLSDAEILKIIQNPKYSYKTSFGCQGMGRGDGREIGQKLPLHKVKFTDMVEPVKKAIVNEIIRDMLYDENGLVRHKYHRRVLRNANIKATLDAMPDRKIQYEKAIIREFNKIPDEKTEKQQYLKDNLEENTLVLEVSTPAVPSGGRRKKTKRKKQRVF